MKQFDYIIQDELGIHARPAGLLVKEAAKFSSNITFSKSGVEGDAKKIFSIMKLGAKQGDSITVTVEGADEDTAAKAIEQFLSQTL